MHFLRRVVSNAFNPEEVGEQGIITHISQQNESMRTFQGLSDVRERNHKI
jgi:hypothetical protein